MWCQVYIYCLHLSSIECRQLLCIVVKSNVFGVGEALYQSFFKNLLDTTTLTIKDHLHTGVHLVAKVLELWYQTSILSPSFLGKHVPKPCTKCTCFQCTNNLILHCISAVAMYWIYLLTFIRIPLNVVCYLVYDEYTAWTWHNTSDRKSKNNLPPCSPSLL